MKKINIIMKGTIILFSILLFLNQISAFAVSSAYYRDNPLRLMQGDTMNFMIVLQNPQGESVSLKANIMQGSEIIQITDSSNIYIVPAGEKKNVNLRATIPEDAKIGQVYPVDIEFITIQKGSSGEFGFGTAIGQNFNVIVTRKDGTTSLLSKGSLTLLISLTIGVIAVVLMITFIVKRKKKRKR